MVWQKQYSLPGTSPGTLRPLSKDAPDARLTAMHYTANDIREITIQDLDADLDSMPQDGVLWLNLEGVSDPGVLEKIGQRFNLHPLCLEDVMNIPQQRSKIEDYEHYDFLIFRVAIDYEIPVRTEQVSLFLGDSYVITFQEQAGDAFDLVRGRLRQNRGRIRRSGADYLAYALLEAAIDCYFPLLEALGERLAELEENV